MGRPVDLTREQAEEIRRAYTGAGLATLAVRYGISVSAVHTIVKGTHWLVRDLPALPPRGNGMGRGQDFQRPGLTARQGSLLSTFAPRSRVQRMQVPCPLCGAKPREACINPRAAYPRPIKKLHEERRAGA